MNMIESYDNFEHDYFFMTLLTERFFYFSFLNTDTKMKFSWKLVQNCKPKHFCRSLESAGVII